MVLEYTDACHRRRIPTILSQFLVFAGRGLFNTKKSLSMLMDMCWFGYAAASQQGEKKDCR